MSHDHSDPDASAQDTLRLVLCDCCGITRVALPAHADDDAFVFCDSCRDDLRESGSYDVIVTLERAS